MPHVVTENCQGCRFTDCVSHCPVECFHADGEHLDIDPDVCIDCGACESVCPVSAIFPEDAVPDKWKNYIEMNKTYFNK